MSTTPTRFPHVAVAREGHLIRTQHAALLEKTRPFLTAGALNGADIATLDAASQRFPVADDADAALAFAFALAAPRQGHLGVELTKLVDRLGDERFNRKDATGAVVDLRLALPANAAAWQTRVRQHDAVEEATPHPTRPFVFQSTGEGAGILMTCRMWRQQRRLADGLRRLATEQPDWTPEPGALKARLDGIYGAGPAAMDNAEARRAAESVTKHRLTVITGGPGTGKTWGIKRVLAVLLESAREEGHDLSIELAAPTGKAAVRMAEAMASEDTIHGVMPSTVASLKALEPRTLHKLMGKLPHKPEGFRHGLTNRLGADIVVVDEASMIDVLMMRHLVEAIAEGKRLVLLGDRDQLASVDAGTVLADVVSGVFNNQSARNPALRACVAKLTKSHRFKLAASVACVAEGLQTRRSDLIAAAVALMCGDIPALPTWKARLDADPRDDGATRIRRIVAHAGPSFGEGPSTHRDALPDEVMQALATPYTSARVENLRHNPRDATWLPPEPGYAAMIRTRLLQASEDDTGAAPLTDPHWHETLLEALGRYRVLTAHRQGHRGVAHLNAWLEVAIQNTLTVPGPAVGHSAGRPRRPERSGAHWLGQPVMITRNSYDVNLRNGDIGLIVPRITAAGKRELTCVFPAPRLKTATAAGIRYVSLARLPEWETALAMTVHKSQGSQFERVALVLPAERGSPILTRELVYTGLTRAKWRVDWVGEQDVLRDALERGVARASGLAGLLWGDGA